MTSDTNSPLNCSGLELSLGGKQILDGISLSVERGAVLGLVGRNGAGKSTLIRVLLGLARSDAGKSRVFGRPSVELNDAVKERLAYVPQQADGFQWMRVGEMLDFIGSFYPRWDRGYVDTMLLNTAIAPSAKLATLSPGERQSVALIRAMATRPELLILDEPAAALDPAARRELMRAIAGRAGESGTTVFFSTHIVTDLERVASHLAMLHHGRLLINTAMDDLKDSYARITYVSEANLPAHIPGELSRRRHADGSISLVINRTIGEPWSQGSAPTGHLLESLGLEDLFVELVK
jgi:ABC-2 type transport system ATP-binding protein